MCQWRSGLLQDPELRPDKSGFIVEFQVPGEAAIDAGAHITWAIVIRVIRPDVDSRNIAEVALKNVVSTFLKMGGIITIMNSHDGQESLIYSPRHPDGQVVELDESGSTITVSIDA